MQVEPQNTIPLIYQITDPNDSTVYFIRAVVYDSLTRNVLSTQNLVSRGSGLWSSTVLAPVDSTGSGRHIHVIIRVYTDSGYTTLSGAYNQQIDKYLVKSASKFGSGGSGGSDVDYEKITKIVRALLEENKQAPISLETIENKLVSIESKVDGIEIPEEKEEKPMDLQPIIGEIQAAEKRINSKMGEIEIPPPIDHSEAIKDVSSDVKVGLGSVYSQNKEFQSQLSDLLDKLNKSLDSNLKTNEKMDKINAYLASDAGTVFVSDPEEAKDPEKEKLISKYFP